MDPKQWLLALAVPVILFSGIIAAFPQNWTLTSAPTTNWTCVASSADGQRLVATAVGGIYVSTNSGISWSPTSAAGVNWQSVASSADGSKLAATGSIYPYGAIYTSTNSGASWIQADANAPQVWGPIASSSDGSELIIGYGGVYTSTNSGADWTAANTWAPSSWILSASSSADGSLMVATRDTGGFWPVGGSVLISTNVFATYSETYLGSQVSSSTVALSATGINVIVVAQSGQILTSTNLGITFAQSGAPDYDWSSVASSADGKRLVAVAGSVSYGQVPNGPIYSSADSGNTWQSNAAPVACWSSVASSADGCKLVAAVNGGGIYTSQTTPTPVLSITPTGSGFVISWLVPSMPFVLQESGDLTTFHWTEATTTPNLNLTNLRHEVSLPLSSTGHFYRLKGL